ncbi:CHASE2 domain-containing protein [Yoonia sp.]|uniref:CHASE2 domain-containing protein n=1 Tax=Yoonia sp. TaxID=2212373 RepID=UPI003F6C3B85
MQKSILLFGLFLVLALVTFRSFDPVPVRSLRLAYFDYLQVVSPREYRDMPVRVVDIDEASLAAYGQWPWSRDLLADLVDKLSANGAAVIAFDVLFAEQDRLSPASLAQNKGFERLLRDDVSPEDLQTLDTDRTFAQAMSRTATVLGVAASPVEGVDAGRFVNAGLVEIGNRPAAALHAFRNSTPLVSGLAAAAVGIGHINVSPTRQEGKVRHVPLLWRTESGPVAALSLEALRIALGQSTFLLRGLGDLEAATGSVQLGGYVIPTTANGEIWVRYRQDDPRLYLSAADVLDGGDPDRLNTALAGQIVLIGTSAAGLLDIRTTALGETVPGVSIHAQIIEQILQETYLKRDDFIAGLELLAVVFLGLVVTLVMARAGPSVSLLSGGFAAALVVGASWWSFQTQSVLLDATYPLFGGALNFGLLTAWRFVVTDRERRMIRRSFSQYLAPSVLSQIEGQGYRIELGGEIRNLTVMFSDIRNFTPLTEHTPPDRLVPLLHELFTGLSQEILDQQGTIDKFIGDSVMAFWNAPLPVEGHERRAALAALGMRDALQRFLDRRKDITVPIEIGIGVHAGDACVGNIGSDQRFNYSAIGEAVNIASRVESSCKTVGFDILATHEIATAAPDLAWLPAGAVAMKGVGKRMPLFLLVGDAALARDPRFLAHQAEHVTLLTNMADGKADKQRLEKCRAMSVDICVRLGRFYDKLPDRTGEIRIRTKVQDAPA